MLEGNILELNFALKDANCQLIEAIGQKVLSLHDRFSIDIYQPQYEQTTVAIVVTLQHMLQDRRTSEAISSSTSFSGS